MTHRGATGANSADGDGAGLMCGIPHSFFQRESERELDIKLPREGEYATGNVFFKKGDDDLLVSHKATFSQIAESYVSDSSIADQMGQNSDPSLASIV
jgi:glutamate synthase (NADPH/NADH)